MRVIKRWAVILKISSQAAISILETLLWNKQAPKKSGGVLKNPYFKITCQKLGANAWLGS
ncbi:hypothetical protein DD763_03295 [Helicobacter pylori]|nr:hypothetical protein DD763_03295 [Helicobacter pylori]